MIIYIRYDKGVYGIHEFPISGLNIVKATESPYVIFEGEVSHYMYRMNRDYLLEYLILNFKEVCRQGVFKINLK